MSANPVFFSERPAGHPQGLGVHGFVIAPPARWLVLDIETGDADEGAVRATMEAWKGPSNWKPETIERKRQEFAEKAMEKAALLDASPVLCVALTTDEPRRLIISGMGGDKPAVEGWAVDVREDERAMLVRLREVLDACATLGTVIVGHNICGFDMPKLRNAYLRHRLKLPAILAPRVLDGDQAAPVVDTSRLFKAYSMEHRDDFCPGLDTMAAGLGIPRPKEVISGADVPRLHRAGEFAAILTYCAVDTACTARAYLLMTGQADDLQ